MNRPNAGARYGRVAIWTADRRIWYGLLLLSALLILSDAIYHRHTVFAVEGWFGFYAVSGFAACVALTAVAAAVRRLVRRDEDYYGERNG